MGEEVEGSRWARKGLQVGTAAMRGLGLSCDSSLQGQSWSGSLAYPELLLQRRTQAEAPVAKAQAHARLQGGWAGSDL